MIKPEVNAKRDERMGLNSEEFLVNSSGLFNDKCGKTRYRKEQRMFFCVSRLDIRMDKGTII